ncbi:unnamed protein product [Larinioides sclopetarius]|uniref:Uncharacterized protein n=1 Tax=Larinioides sclopetarius TaxID=280406 RepID=A0AAV2AQ57_9ARAC
MKHFTLVLGVFFAVCVFWSNGYINEDFLKQWHCISESGDNDLCNEFKDCIHLAPECLNLPYYYCMRKVQLDGPGSCSETEQLYVSKEHRIEINKCYAEVATMANGDEWVTNKEIAPFLDCVERLGEKCESRKSSKSSESSSKGSSESSSSGSSESSSSGSRESHGRGCGKPGRRGRRDSSESKSSEHS